MHEETIKHLAVFVKHLPTTHKQNRKFNAKVPLSTIVTLWDAGIGSWHTIYPYYTVLLNSEVKSCFRLLDNVN